MKLGWSHYAKTSESSVGAAGGASRMQRPETSRKWRNAAETDGGECVYLICHQDAGKHASGVSFPFAFFFFFFVMDGRYAVF